MYYICNYIKELHMKISKQNIGGVYIIKDVPRKNPCMNCSNCIRLRIMEMGLIPGTKVLLDKHQLGLWILKILNDNGISESTIALRNEEAERIVLEDDCLISLERD